MFDDQGHASLLPSELFNRAAANPIRLIDDVLMWGTPAAFTQFASYCDFLHAVAERIDVHPRNLFVRGSCHIGYSIAPKPKVWTAMSNDSDIDLCVVDARYFHRLDDEVQRWEETNRADLFRGAWLEGYAARRQDRYFNCCRDYRLPPAVCVHHQDVMASLPVDQYCGLKRDLSAFIFRDWWSVRRRYEYDLRELVKGVSSGTLLEAPDQPLPSDSA